MNRNLVKHKCPECSHPLAELVDTCVIYDKYYICAKCGYADFDHSKKLNPTENGKRMRQIGIFYLIDNVEGE